MSAEAGSIYTDNDMRDNDLKSASYFDAEKFPSVTFKSTSFKKAKAANNYTVKGNLTMHGITKQVTLVAIARLGVNPMSKKNIAGFKISGKVNRLDFGIGSGTPSAIISNEVIIDANAEFIKN